MLNSLSLMPTHPALLRAQAYLAAHPNLNRALKWLAVLSVSLIVLFLIAHVGAQTLNTLTDGTAAKACTESKSLTSNKWLKVFILVAFGVAVVGVARKQRDGWTNLIWIIVLAALVGSVWQIAAVFGISC